LSCLVTRPPQFSAFANLDTVTLLLPNDAAVVKKFGHVLLILALLGATGGHWAVLQTIAWADMLATNLQTESVGAAITKTFDGAHPCKMCKQISAGKKAEKKADLTVQLKKLEFVSLRPAWLILAPQEFHTVAESAFAFESIPHRPTVPPPRRLAV
jgi:hypothetical protein